MKKWVVFDVDDVLLNFVESLYDAGKKHNLLSTDLHWKDWNSYNHLDYFTHKNQDDFRKFLVDQRVIEGLKPFPEVKSVIQEISKNYEIGFLTSRGYHPRAKEITENSIGNHFDIDGKVVIAGLHGMKKTDFLKEFDGEVVAYIDDTIMHVKDFQAIGIKAALRRQKWNEKEISVPVVNDLEEFYKFIESK